MGRGQRVVCVVLALAMMTTGVAGAGSALSSEPLSVTAGVGTPSVWFVENVGQFGEGARFQVRGGEQTMWLAQDGLWVTLLGAQARAAAVKVDGGAGLSEESAELSPVGGVNLKLSFVGANPQLQLEPFNWLETHLSYFIGNDPDKWHADVPVWGGVRYVDLYPGIDLLVAGEGGRAAHWIVAREGADLSQVRLQVEGADYITLDGDTLLVGTATGQCVLPLLQVSGSGARVEGQATVEGSQVVAPFAAAVAAAQAATALAAVDLAYSTFLGGAASDYGYDVIVDGQGSAYVVGTAWAVDFPVTAGVFDTVHNGNSDVFVAKLNPAGSGLVYATFLGGADNDNGYGIDLDGAGNAYVTGQTCSSDFPALATSYDWLYNGSGDAFVTKLNTTGTALHYSTFVGGTSIESGEGIAVDPTGQAHIAGVTHSLNFPVTVGALDTSMGGVCDGFVVKMNAAGSAMLFATYLGGGSAEVLYGIDVDLMSNACVTGYTASADYPCTLGALDNTLGGSQDALFARIGAAGNLLVYSTYLGGGANDGGWDLAVDSSGKAYLTGETASVAFPVSAAAFDTSFNGGAYDAFVVNIDLAGAMVYGTFYGGNQDDRGRSIAIDAGENAHIVGFSNSVDLPMRPGSYDSSHGSPGVVDAFVAKLNHGGTALPYATYLGGAQADSGQGVAIDAGGYTYVTGYTASSDFPTTLGAYDATLGGVGVDDAFVSKLEMKLARNDCDGDQRSDLIVFRPSVNAWFASLSGTNYGGVLARAWGATGDIPLTGDVDGDERADLIVYRPAFGVWYALTSMSGFNAASPFIVGWGTPGDQPMSGDVDGDGKLDPMIFRPSVNAWIALTSGSNYAVGLGRAWGASGDIPLTGDLDGDMMSDMIVFRPSVGVWFGLLSGNNYNAASYFVQGWGASGDVPLSGDMDGDGKMDLVIYRPSNGVWFVLTSSSGYTVPFGKAWGAAGDVPISGDIDGDGKMDLIVYRPTYGVWFGLLSSHGYSTATPFVKGWGASGDRPVP